MIFRPPDLNFGQPSDLRKLHKISLMLKISSNTNRDNCPSLKAGAIARLEK